MTEFQPQKINQNSVADISMISQDESMFPGSQPRPADGDVSSDNLISRTNNSRAGQSGINQTTMVEDGGFGSAIIPPESE